VDVAAGCLQEYSAAPDPDAQVRHLWRHFAPGVGFDDRAEALLARANAAIAGRLAQFQRQYLAWKERPDVLARASGYWHLATLMEADVIGAASLLAGVLPEERFFEPVKNDIPLVIRIT
jgi:hypothetical protein